MCPHSRHIISVLKRDGERANMVTLRKVDFGRLLAAILRSPRRFPIGFSVVALLFVASVLTSVTDMPGYYYVPGFYQLVLLQ